jgi:putative membrane protein
MMWFDGNTMGWFGWTMMILFWVVIVALVVLAIRSTATTRTGPGPASDADRSGPGPASDAVSILERRYAAGEIDRNEFEERKRVLDDSRRTGS